MLLWVTNEIIWKGSSLAACLGVRLLSPPLGSCFFSWMGGCHLSGLTSAVEAASCCHIPAVVAIFLGILIVRFSFNYRLALTKKAILPRALAVLRAGRWSDFIFRDTDPRWGRHWFLGAFRSSCRVNLATTGRGWPSRRGPKGCADSRVFSNSLSFSRNGLLRRLHINFRQVDNPEVVAAL